MFIHVVRLFVVIAGWVIGWTQISPDAKGILIGTLAAVGIIAVEIAIDYISLDSLIAGVIGTCFGLILVKLIYWLLWQMENPQVYEMAQKFSLLVYLAFGFLGMVVGVKKKSELELLDRDLIVKGGKKRLLNTFVVDTSALIDGRVADVCEAKFVSGTLVVPRFMLHELQAVADSSDTAKRARGRRGLDILSRMQENPDVPVKVFDKDYPEIKEVDAKLVALARELGAKLITTDFNLNKIASLQGVTVLNVNDLANALKPVVLPGEVMSIFVLKEGKERDQGVGYLNDGTMVVVEEGRRFIGRRLDVTVASILQTSAGRMIFTKARPGVHEHKESPEGGHAPAVAEG